MGASSFSHIVLLLLLLLHDPYIYIYSPTPRIHTYQVGVHIADVSYFVREFTPLDVEAARRATTVSESVRLFVWVCPACRHRRLASTRHRHPSSLPCNTTMTGVPGAEGGAHAPAPPLRAALQVGWWVHALHTCTHTQAHRLTPRPILSPPPTQTTQPEPRRGPAGLLGGVAHEQGRHPARGGPRVVRALLDSLLRQAGLRHRPAPRRRRCVYVHVRVCSIP